MKYELPDGTHTNDKDVCQNQWRAMMWKSIENLETINCNPPSSSTVKLSSINLPYTKNAIEADEPDIIINDISDDNHDWLLSIGYSRCYGKPGDDAVYSI